jgi:hypothetical protein
MLNREAGHGACQCHRAVTGRVAACRVRRVTFQYRQAAAAAVADSDLTAGANLQCELRFPELARAGFMGIIEPDIPSESARD